MMSFSIYEYYSLNNLDYWLNQEPYDVLAANVGNARKAAELEAGIGLNLQYTDASSNQGEIIFDTDPPISFGELSVNLAHHVMAILHLVVIGYHYRRPHEKRYWNTPENFDFEITITKNFDAPAYGREHQFLPPLSMLMAVSRSFVEHA